MGRISKYAKIITPGLDDLLVGTDVQNNNDTKNFNVGSLVGLVNSVAGRDYITYKFSLGNSNSVGAFTSDNSKTNPATITKLFFNKTEITGENLSVLFNKLDTLQNIAVSLRNPGNANNFATFKVINITDRTDYFEFDVVLYKSFSLGLLSNETTYSFYFDVKETFDDKLEVFIKSDELLSLASRKGDTLYGILDKYTGEEITLSKVTGTPPMVDGIIYFQLNAGQLNTEYFKRNNLEKLNVNNFGAKGDNVQDDTQAIQLMIDKLGYFNLSTGTYKITSSLLVRNITFYDTNFRGIDVETSIINCVNMSSLSAIKEESTTDPIRANFYNFKIIGDPLNAINLNTTLNIYLSRFENLSLSATNDCFLLKNDFDCSLNNVIASSTNGNSFTMYGLNTLTLNNCYAAVCGASKSGFRIYSFATLISCNGVNSGGTWGTFGATIAEDGFDATAFINFIGCNFEDYFVRALRFSYVAKVNLIGCSFYPKETGTYSEDLKFENVDNNINISGVIYSSKGSTITSASRIVSINDIGFIQSNSVVFQDFSRPYFNLVYKIPFYSMVNSEYGIKSLNIPYLNCDRNYGFNLQTVKTWTTNNANFSVMGQTKVKTANTSTTGYNSATEGIEGQELFILIKDSFTTINHMNAGFGSFKMISGANVVGVGGQIYHFIYDGGYWVQL
jgi:hypothetical protein